MRVWSIRQIIRRCDLIREGSELQHCVGSYFPRCRDGQTSIWSLKRHGLYQAHRVLTIELDPQSREVVTALGKQNSSPTTMARRVMERWAQRNQLSIASWV